MKQKILSLFLLTAFILSVGMVNAVTLAEWNLVSNGNPSNVNTNINAGIFTGGEGISAVTSESRSPRSSPMNAVASPGSPWGHFVDILVPLDEESPTTTTTVSYDYDAYSLEPSDVPPPLFSLRSIEKNKPFVHKRRRRQEYLPLLSGSSSTVLTPHPYRLQARKHGGVRERSPPDSTDTSSSLWRNPFELPAAAVANYNHEQQQQQQQQEVETALQHLTV